MKDVTFGVKVPESFRNQINVMMKESGLVGREFMQELVDAYLLDENKQEVPEMTEEVKELQALTHRINDIYLYLGTRFQNIKNLNEKEKEDMDEFINESKASHEEDLVSYKEQVKNVEEEMKTCKDKYKEIEEVNKKLTTKIDAITGYNANYQELNNQYKNNIQELTKKLNAHQPLKEENDKLVKVNHQLKESNDDMASELWFAKREIEKLNESLIKNKKESDQQTAYLKDQYQLEKQTTVLELQLENQKNVERLNTKLATIQESYHEKLKEFILEIEHKQKEPVKKGE